MNFGKTMLVGVLLGSVVTSSTAFAQSPRMGAKAAAASARQDPYQMQNFAAMKKSTSDPAFREALNDARAGEVKRILVRNGAYPKIVLLVEKKPTFVGSSTGQFDLNGGSGNSGQWYCWKWQAVPHYFPDGAFWYYTMACLGWATMGGPGNNGLPIILTP
jgi:hypothetical protein